MSKQNTHSEYDDSLLSAYVDGELTAAERAAVVARLAEDPQAQELVAALESVSLKVRSLPRSKAAGDVRAAVLKQLGGPTTSLPRSELSMRRRLLWPLLATAALVMLMLYQPEVKEDQVEVAQIDQVLREEGLAKERNESALRSVPAIEAIEEESTVSSNEAAVDELAASSSLDRSGRGRDDAADLAAPTASLGVGRAAGSIAPTEPNVGLVHITLTDLQSGAEHFDRLLVSNGVQLVNESGEDPAGMEKKTATSQDSNSPADFQGGGGGEWGAAATRESQSSAAQMVLVEAPPDQIAQILFACNQDTEAIESVTIDEAEMSDAGAQYRQYEKPDRKQAPSQTYAVSPEQQGVIAALNSLNIDQKHPQSPTGPAAAGVPLQPQQAWATRLRSDQISATLEQLESQVQFRRNQAQNFAIRNEAADNLRKFAKKDADQPQQVRVLFFLHPSESQKK